MNHDYAHCLDFKSTCPDSCFRAQLVREIEEVGLYGIPVTWGHFKGTEDCEIATKEQEFKRKHSYIGQNVRWIRKRNFVTQEQLSLEAGTSQGRISAIERGDTLPTCAEIVGIANFFGVSFDSILRKDGIMIEEGTERFKLREENNYLKAQNKELKDKLNHRRKNNG